MVVNECTGSRGGGEWAEWGWMNEWMNTILSASTTSNNPHWTARLVLENGSLPHSPAIYILFYSILTRCSLDHLLPLYSTFLCTLYSVLSTLPCLLLLSPLQITTDTSPRTLTRMASGPSVFLRANGNNHQSVDGPSTLACRVSSEQWAVRVRMRMRWERVGKTRLSWGWMDSRVMPCLKKKTLALAERE